MKTITRFFIGVIFYVSTLLGVISCSNQSSSADTLSATVYSYTDGTELYCVYSDGSVINIRNEEWGTWTSSVVYIGNHSVPCIQLTFDGHTTSCSICEGKIYWGGSGAIKDKYPHGTSLEVRELDLSKSLPKYLSE